MKVSKQFLIIPLDYSNIKHRVAFHQEIDDNVRIVRNCWYWKFPSSQKFDCPPIKIDQNKLFDPITGF